MSLADPACLPDHLTWTSGVLGVDGLVGVRPIAPRTVCSPALPRMREAGLVEG